MRVIKPRRLKWAGRVVRILETRSAFDILTGKQKGKRPLGRRRLRWEDTIRKDLKEILGIGLIQLRIGTIGRAIVNVALNFRFP